MKMIVYGFLVLLAIFFVVLAMSEKNSDLDEQSEFGPRIALSLPGALLSGLGAAFFAANIDDPERYAFVGFVAGPIAILIGLVALTVGMFFPVKDVKAWMKRFFSY